MSEALEHHCALAGMRAKENCPQNVASVIQALIYEMWQRAGAGWGLRGVIGGKLDARAGGVKKATLSHVIQGQAKKEVPVTTAIGHGRYVTSGDDDPSQLQPFTFDAAGMQWAFAFNGNLANYPALKEELGIEKPNVDTEAIRRILRAEIEQRTEAIRTDVRSAMQEVFSALEAKFDGCFNIVLINQENQLFAYRDRHGFRPLVWTRTNRGDVLVASEDSAVRRLYSTKKTEPINHLGAGKLLVADADGEEEIRVADPALARCFFEYVYFARDLSRLDETSVAELRSGLGHMLALVERGEDPSVCVRACEPGPVRRALSQTWLKVKGALHRASGQKFRQEKYRNAICFGVPWSAVEAGASYAETLGIPYVQAVRRLPESDRSFTSAPDRRERVAQEKFEYFSAQIAGKDVYMVEDSVVRGTTMKVVAGKLRDLGARSLHLRITSPAVIGPCFYGIDIPTIRELLLGKFRDAIIANDWKLPEEVEAVIAQELGVDTVKFLSVESLLAVFDVCGITPESLCTACVKGTQDAYPTCTGKERLLHVIAGTDAGEMTGE